MPSPPLDPTLPNEERVTISRHDSINATRDSEVNRLKEAIKVLQTTNTNLTRDRDRLSQELRTCNSELAEKRQEALAFAGKLSKESRNAKRLSEEMATLQEDNQRELRDTKAKLDHEKKMRVKERLGAKKEVAELRSQLDAKQSTVKEVRPRIPDKKRHLQVSQTTDYRPQSSIVPKTNTDETSSVQSSSVSELHETIKNLHQENARLKGIHHEDGCEEFQRLALQLVADAKELQAAAEADAEGLRHVEKANDILIEDHVLDVKCLHELIRERDRYRIQAEDTIGNLRVEQHHNLSAVQQTEVVDPAYQLLGLSNVAYLCTSPIAPINDNANIVDCIRHLRAAELEVESLASQNDKLLVELADMKVQEPQKSCFDFSNLQTVSTVPRTPVPASTLLTNPALLFHLEDLGKSIMSLSDAPQPKVVMKPATELPTAPLLPSVALTINIQHTDKRNYSLLQRVQSIISATSSLDIHGPKEVVKHFVASMHDAETDHAEKSQLVVQLEKVIEQNHVDIEALEAQLRDKRKCSDPEHRTLVDDLAAKNVQFAMQEQLLAQFRKENV